MKKLFAILGIFCVAASAISEGLTVSWVNGTNPAGTMTMVLYSTTPGAYTTNQSVTVSSTVTTYTFTNLLAGTRYYFTAKHLDPNDGDLSEASNEAGGKTKMNPPKNLNAGQP